ncbi:GntP family permease [Nocardioides jensenii]|uniref:GntP family permease n=1 Tax=Nocardioides jensenii TaxID=1843 RepID=UPI00082CE240|nr:SLC13 family permease [Nocardioides jensenii]
MDWVVIHTVIAIAGVVALIVAAKVDPVISLIAGAAYMGLANGLGMATTVKTITAGFAGIMLEVGLLIGFGVVIGSLLHEAGAFRRLVQALVRRVGAGRMPLAMTSILAAIMPSIYVDVQVVLASPVARSTAPSIGSRGLPKMASAVAIGIFSGYVFMVPGLAVLLITGKLGIGLGTWLPYGVVLALATAAITTVVVSLLFKMGFWDSSSDEEVDEAMAEQEAADESGDTDSNLPLAVLFLPILVPLLLIAFAAFASEDVLDFSNAYIAFFGDANVAMFIGLVLAYVMSRMARGQAATETAMTAGYHTSGEILLITGVGGSLGEVIKATDLKDVLSGLFSADHGAPIILTLLLAWVIAAVLHLAIGSVSVGALAAAGIIGPVLSTLDIAPVAVGLAIASGAMFALHVNSNFFWMFKALMGLSTKGTFKTLTLATTVGSVVSLPLVMVIGFIA